MASALEQTDGAMSSILSWSCICAQCRMRLGEPWHCSDSYMASKQCYAVGSASLRKKRLHVGLLCGSCSRWSAGLVMARRHLLVLQAVDWGTLVPRPLACRCQRLPDSAQLRGRSRSLSQLWSTCRHTDCQPRHAPIRVKSTPAPAMSRNAQIPLPT